MVINATLMVRKRIDTGDMGSESWVRQVAEQKALPFGNCLHDLGWRGEVEGTSFGADASILPSSSGFSCPARWQSR